MIKRAVLIVLMIFSFLLSSPKEVSARSNLLEIIFKTPFVVKHISSQKNQLFYYLDHFRQMRDKKVLSEQTENEKSTKDFPDVPAADLFYSLPKPSPTIELSPTPKMIETTPAVEKAEKTTKSSTTPVPSSDNSPTSYILNQINTLRRQKGLQTSTKDSYTCNFADLRAKELSMSFSHNGFIERKNTGNLPYPSWHDVTENIAMNSDYKAVFDRWKSSSGHMQNMLADTTHICVGKYGNYYAMEGWTP